MRDSPSQQPEKKNECDPRCRYAPGDFIEKEKQLVSRYDMYYSNIEKNCRDRILSGTVWQMGSYGGRL